MMSLLLVRRKQDLERLAYSREIIHGATRQLGTCLIHPLSLGLGVGADDAILGR